MEQSYIDFINGMREGTDYTFEEQEWLESFSKVEGIAVKLTNIGFILDKYLPFPHSANAHDEIMGMLETPPTRKYIAPVFTSKLYDLEKEYTHKVLY